MMKYILLLPTLFLLLVGFVHAASDDFSVRMSIIGTDTTPPSTPTALVATPIAQTQIDLSWGASTDDLILDGYQVFRDAIQIATTTLTTYSDSGLTASTTYTYFVKAYDSFLNISSSSNSVATTTLPVLATSTPVTSSNSGGSQSNLELVSFTLIPSQHTANVQWKTNRYAQFELRWGRSSSYELGFVTSNLFVKENTTLIADLQPGTIYEYQLVAHDKEGLTSILKEGQFTTLDSPDTQAPANVANLKAIVDDDDIHLSWTNPKDEDFSYVRIIRNYLFYPTDSYDGYVVYQNDGNQVFDRDALQQKKVQYYTVFSYDKKGNISSGAVVVARELLGTKEVVVVASSTLPLRISDIELVQNNNVIDSKLVDADLPLTFRIAYEKLPEHLKTITIALTHPQNAEIEFSFLLKINKDKTYYEATIAPLEVVGLYPTTVSVFDYQLQQLYTVQKPILVTRSDEKGVIFGIPLSTKKIGLPAEIAVLFWFLLLWLLLYLLYRISLSTSLEHRILTAFKTRLALSILLCVGFGGVSAYLFKELGAIQPEGSTTMATVFQGVSPTENSGFIIVTVLMASLVFATFGIVFHFLKKK